MRLGGGKPAEVLHRCCGAAAAPLPAAATAAAGAAAGAPLAGVSACRGVERGARYERRAALTRVVGVGVGAAAAPATRSRAQPLQLLLGASPASPLPVALSCRLHDVFMITIRGPGLPWTPHLAASSCVWFGLSGAAPSDRGERHVDSAGHQGADQRGWRPAAAPRLIAAGPAPPPRQLHTRLHGRSQPPPRLEPLPLGPVATCDRSGSPDAGTVTLTPPSRQQQLTSRPAPSCLDRRGSPGEH